MLAKELKSIILPSEVTSLQYIDVTRVGGTEEKMVHQSMHAIIQHLLELNISVPDFKQQGPSQEATFSGTQWIGGQKTVPESVLIEMQSIQAPPDKKELRPLLGTLGAWKSHTPGFHILEKTVYNLLKKNTGGIGNKITMKH